ncbi:MAG: uroporphyrinogen decarboxylase [Candidatus Brocadia sp. AMX2]|uniref:Methyltransferase MtaA/CmuA family n=1 Tax=Candidatus Brocadia sinica JPN1 TaxID=1197129 RepID=A0ABQ0JWV6_9BACT|nr:MULTISPECIES: uroporphyrinogen decarboxylase family protein [Brocadia]KXK30382.1 MAG: putative uroporphyrinogen decarboxylase [Candidatus Brocadia sinica]MBC6931038.1 uroporphyrinogen decarboxylase [Candidatus Brocadia sp.]MBL1168185.1 uroporphyrinogen decarboxylase [Candidatus Brocadia sp. AMX1]NOG40958.1 uroporphyrinogen decarboxylase [Planctomycetota bacterium]KAA0244295.1 MAG: uroporphyrinogen decarboxylase [Candidatus Brocadia sp. AMX2]
MNCADEMTPKERMLAILQGKDVDRFLVSPLILNYASRSLNLTVRSFCTNGKNMGDANIACFKKYHHDIVYIFSTTSTLAEAMGTKMYFPEDDAPQVETPFIQTREDLKKLKPVDPEKDGRLPVYLEAVKRCVDVIGNEVFIVPVIGAPFTTSAALRGTETFIKELYTDPELIHTVMKVATQSVKNLIDAFVKAGGVPVTVEPVATGSMISERHFREFVLPYLKEVYAHIHSFSLPGVLHICGKTKRVIQCMAESGADILSIDNIDLFEAKTLVGDKVCLMGNVSPADGMLKGNPEVITTMVKDCVIKASDNPKGFVLATGCEVPIKTPHENMVAFLEAGRRFARLPIHVN